MPSLLPVPNQDFIGLTGLPQGFTMPQFSSGSVQSPLTGGGGGDLGGLLQMLQQQQLGQARALPQIARPTGAIPGLPDPGSSGSQSGGLGGSPGGLGTLTGGMPSFNFSLASLGPQGFSFGGQPSPSLNLGVGPGGIGVQGNISQTPGVNQAFNSVLGGLAGRAGGATGLGWGSLAALAGAPMLGSVLGPMGSLLGLISTINAISQGIPGTFANSIQGIEGARGWATPAEIAQAYANLQLALPMQGGVQQALGVPGSFQGPQGAQFGTGQGRSTPSAQDVAPNLASFFSSLIGTGRGETGVTGPSEGPPGLSPSESASAAAAGVTGGEASGPGAPGDAPGPDGE